MLNGQWVLVNECWSMSFSVDQYLYQLSTDIMGEACKSIQKI